MLINRKFPFQFIFSVTADRRYSLVHLGRLCCYNAVHCKKLSEYVQTLQEYFIPEVFFMDISRTELEQMTRLIVEAVVNRLCDEGYADAIYIING